MEKRIVMVTKGLRGRENPTEYHEACLAVVREHYASKDIDVTITSSTGVTNNHDYEPRTANLMSFAKVIGEEMAIAEEIVFMDDWEKYRGCQLEHQIAQKYEIPCVYLSSGEV